MPRSGWINCAGRDGRPSTAICDTASVRDDISGACSSAWSISADATLCSVILAGAVLAIFSGWYAAGHLGITTDTDEMFAASLPWRQRAEMFKKLFPQFQDLLVAVIDAKEPEEAEETAAALAAALASDHAHFLSVRRPDASPFLKKEGLLFLETSQLEPLIDRMIDAQPFLGELAKDPSARGLVRSAFPARHAGSRRRRSISRLIGRPWRRFDEAMASALAGHPHPLSWVRLFGGELADLGGRYKFVLVQPRLDHTEPQPGGAATRAIREAASQLEFVKSGDARVRITGNVALADEEFASVARGRRRGTDRQHPADHAVAVSRGPLLAADRCRSC